MTQMTKNFRLIGGVVCAAVLMLISAGTANAQSGSRNAIPTQSRSFDPANSGIQNYTPSPVYRAPVQSQSVGCVGCAQAAAGPVFNQQVAAPSSNYSYRPSSTYQAPSNNLGYSSAYSAPQQYSSYRAPVYNSFRSPVNYSRQVRYYRPIRSNYGGSSYRSYGGSSCGGY